MGIELTVSIDVKALKESPNKFSGLRNTSFVGRFLGSAIVEGELQLQALGNDAEARDPWHEQGDPWLQSGAGSSWDRSRNA